MDPFSGVLRNLLGLTDPDLLDAAEAALVGVRDVQIVRDPLPGLYDLKHLQLFHRTLFQDVYLWAGEIRTVDIGKGSMQFCGTANITAYADTTVFPIVEANDYFRDLNHGDAAIGLATLIGEINALHPFREGNGRTQRAFVRQLAASAGWRLNWEELDSEANIAASIAAMVGDYAPFVDLIGARLTPIP